jgi:UDP:flavonoid glycosyltransferase YjiC (YdhE family)
LRITIVSTGSQGDAVPYVALGMGLQAAGHKVTIGTHTDFAPMVRSRGLDFAAIADDSRALHESLEGRKMLVAQGNPFVFMRRYSEMRKRWMRSLVARIYAACKGADRIFVSSTAFLPGQAVCEKLGVPMVPIHYVSNCPSRAIQHCLMPEAPAWLPGRGFYNWLSYIVVGEYFWQAVGTWVNDARVNVLGLKPLPPLGPPLALFADLQILYGFSPLVVPRPTDIGPHHEVTGFWYLDRLPDWRPPTALVDFLDAGPPPVSIGFGSMQGSCADEITELVTKALKRCGQRGILLTGWGGLCPANHSDQIFAIQSVPHDWLFPRMAAVVHHGGAGTTASGLRAGVPNVIVPFMADQPFWGRRVAALGVGPEPIYHTRLTVERLAHAIRAAVNDPLMRMRAAALGAKLQVENGVGNAVEAFHRFVEGPAFVPRRVSIDGSRVSRNLQGFHRKRTTLGPRPAHAGGVRVQGT